VTRTANFFGDDDCGRFGLSEVGRSANPEAAHARKSAKGTANSSLVGGPLPCFFSKLA
jgi:hypothetical protein